MPVPKTESMSNPAMPTAAPRPARSFQDWLYSPKGVLVLVTLLMAWRVAILLSDAIPVSFDEAQYWGWSKDLAFGYYSKPPLLAWAIAAVTGVCGDGPG